MSTFTRPEASVRLPRYQQIALELKNKIEGGVWQPGDRLPSFAEMYELYTATPAMVDQAFGILEREGLIVREKRRGVFVAPPQLRAATGVLGCMGFGFAHREDKLQHRLYWSHLLEGIRAGATQAGREILLCDHLAHFNGWEKVDGVILAGGNVQQLPPTMPCVSVINAVAGATNILADHEGGGRAMTEHLLELGHRRIGFLTFPHAPHSQLRIKGYRAALKAAGVRFNARWIRKLAEPGDPHVDYLAYGEDKMAQWLRDDWAKLGCTALLCENDQTAIGAMAALRAAGLRVPKDVSVVGFDGTEICDYSQPRLTTVEVPLHEIGARAARELLRRVNEETVTAENIVLPVRLRVHKSTASAS